MFASTAVARRALLAGARRIPSTPVAAFSTQTQTQISLLEKKLEDLHWKNIKDQVQELRHLMNEPKTNHAVHEPDALFTSEVESKMADIYQMLNSPAPNREAVDHVVFEMKKSMKDKMYGSAWAASSGSARHKQR